MSLDKKLCELVKQHWNDLYSTSNVPDSLIFLKVAGKNSPNATIIGMILDVRHRKPVAVAKIPRNPQSAPGLFREYEAMVDLRNSINDISVLEHTSCRGSLEKLDGVNILLQVAGLGHPMVREMTSPKSVETLYKKILSWMFDFHADGAEKIMLEDKMLHLLVEAPIVRFRKKFRGILSTILSEKSRQYLSALPQKINGRMVYLCRQHGDFNAHNILVKFKSKRLIDFTIIDWEDYRTRQLPIHDLNHFLTSNSHLLGSGMSPVDSYIKFVLNKGWYHDLCVKAVTDYGVKGIIDKDTFWLLTPLYFIEMCLRVTDVQRKQENTIQTWVKRMNAFCETYLRNLL